MHRLVLAAVLLTILFTLSHATSHTAIDDPDRVASSNDHQTSPEDDDDNSPPAIPPSPVPKPVGDSDGNNALPPASLEDLELKRACDNDIGGYFVRHVIHLATSSTKRLHSYDFVV